MRRSMMALSLMVVLAGAAEAATLVTPAVQIGENGRAVCSLVNTTDRDIPVLRWEIVFDDGRVLEEFPGSTLRANLSLEINENAANARVGGGLWHCRAVVAGSGKKVRLSICPIGSDGNCGAVAAAP